MKKTAVIMAAVALFFVSCKELSRVNPTDPESSNFIGISYIGEAGEFSSLSAIVVTGGYVYCVDANANNLSKYRLGGELVWKTTTPGTFNTPVGIAADASALYVVDKSSSGNYNLKVFDFNEPPSILGASFLTPTAIDRVASDGTYFYTASTDPPAIYKYSTGTGDPYPNDIAYNWGIVKGSADGQMQKISDIDVMSDGNIAAVDPVLNRITVFTAAGAFVKNIGVDAAITDIAVKGGRLVVPSAKGVYEIDYSGTVLKVWGNFGEGAGKITKACPVAYGDKYYVFGNGGSMKFFYEK